MNKKDFLKWNGPVEFNRHLLILFLLSPLSATSYWTVISTLEQIYHLVPLCLELKAHSNLFSSDE